MPDLHARLLAEIERRKEPTREQLARMGTKWGHGVVSRELAYLAALRGVVELHADGGYSQGFVDDPDRASGRRYSEFYHCCGTCGTLGEFGVRWPCKTLLAVATALDVTP